MKKFLLLLCTLLIGGNALWATVTQPTLTTDVNNPTYYVIKNYRYGTYANYVDASTQMTQVNELSLNTLWFFVENSDGVSIVPAADPTVKIAYPKTDNDHAAVATDEGAKWYVNENKNNKGFFALSLTTAQSGTGDCWDANAQSKVGTWRPTSTDFAGTSWVIAETVVTKADIDGATLATALTNSAFAIQKAEALARLGALSTLAVYTDARLAAVRNAADASALSEALEAFNTDITMYCRSNKFLNVGESGGSHETTQSVIQLVSAGGGAFYLKGKTSGKYLGSVATSTAIGSDDLPTTAFYIEPYNGYTVAHPTNTSWGGYQYIHNGGGGCVGWVPSGQNTQYTISEPAITNVAEISANKAYYITTASRGAWMVPNSATAVTSTTAASFAPLKTDAKQQFAFIHFGNNYFLYSVSAKKFVSKSGNYTTLTDAYGDNVTLLATTNAAYPTVVAFQDGAYQGGVSNNYTPAVITFWNDLSDDGNQAKIVEVADFDPTEALEAFNTTVNVTYEVRDGETLIDSETVLQEKNSAVSVPASLLSQTFVYNYAPSGSIGTSDCTITVARTVKTGVVTAVGDLSNNKAYKLVTERGTFTTDNGALVNTAKTGSDYTVYNFAIVYYDATDDAVDNGNYYLWSVQDNKFVAGSGTALTETPTAITMNALTGPLFKFQCGTNYMNCNANGGSFGSWSTTDGGNSVAIIEAADFDPTPVIAAITNVASSVIANIKPFFDEAGDDLFQLKSSVAEANNATYTAALTMCSPATYDALLEIISNADNFNLPESGKFYYVKNVSNNKYLQATGMTRGNILADVDAPGISSIVKVVERDGKIYMGAEGGEFSWVYGSGYSGMMEASGKYAHFSVTTPGQGAFAHALGNGETGYESYLPTAYYAVGGENVVVGSTADAAAAQWTFEEVDKFDFEISDAGYATLFLPFAVTIPSGVTAYAISNISGNSLTLAEIETTIPAGTAVVLEGAKGSYTFEIITGGSYDGDNELEGTYFQMAAPNESYILQDHDDTGVGFYKVNTSEATPNIPANRSYLPASAVGGGVKAYFFNKTDVIKDVFKGVAAGEIYDLSGVQVSKMQKGKAYIVNGTSVILK